MIHYPALQDARIQIEEQGIPGVTVEILANDLDSAYHDIRVRVAAGMMP